MGVLKNTVTFSEEFCHGFFPCVENWRWWVRGSKREEGDRNKNEKLMIAGTLRY